MANLPINFRNSGEGAIATYTYTDIAAGTGVQTFYAATAPSGTNFLTDKQIYSDIVFLSRECPLFTLQTTEGGASALVDYDFDVTFNLPRSIKGDCFVEIPEGIRKTAVGASNTFQRMHAYIRKWNGSTETNLVSMSGSIWDSGSGSATKTNLTVLNGNIPLTHFKKGETLRLTIQDRTWNVGQDYALLFFGVDPQGRLTSDNSKVSGGALTFATGDPTALRLFIPFRIDL